MSDGPTNPYFTTLDPSALDRLQHIADAAHEVADCLRHYRRLPWPGMGELESDRHALQDLWHAARSLEHLLYVQPLPSWPALDRHLCAVTARHEELRGPPEAKDYLAGLGPVPGFVPVTDARYAISAWEGAAAGLEREIDRSRRHGPAPAPVDPPPWGEDDLEGQQPAVRRLLKYVWARRPRAPLEGLGEAVWGEPLGQRLAARPQALSSLLHKANKFLRQYALSLTLPRKKNHLNLE
jgi:hypothetical protein